MALDRRAFLRLAAAAPFAASAASVFGAERYLLQMNGYPLNAETPLELLTDYLTPNDLFFVRSHWIPRVPDPRSWRLVVDGDVRTPLRLSLDDLKKMPRAEATCVLQCAGNGRGLQSPPMPGVQWSYGAVGNARWSGVRLRDVLVRAGVKHPAAKHLHLFGSDDPPGKVPPFHRSIELGKAMDDCILAYEMNGQPLPKEHGAPLRLVVPGWAGDHWMKWLVRLTASAKPQTGFFMDTAYRWPIQPGAPGVAFKPEEMRPLTEIAVKSNITSAPARLKLGTTADIRGFAFSGAPDIAKVEVSDDGMKTFHRATLDTRHAPHAWRLWSYRWTPKRRGPHQITVRATDSRGATQPAVTVWNQSGYLYNAWHSATIEVTG
ncbi:MAG TPA: sulfite oxidase [Thermoanaerobaculia bacterium]|jgi:DMSO/TMAO reductase YedYZ molybdopterin-dependent catalytic subunit|nr:sulfite oxidase [Thermoanaerobaculia bacterium]